jgi:hypothetical protein
VQQATAVLAAEIGCHTFRATGITASKLRVSTAAANLLSVALFRPLPALIAVKTGHCRTSPLSARCSWMAFA